MNRRRRTTRRTALGALSGGRISNRAVSISARLVDGGRPRLCRVRWPPLGLSVARRGARREVVLFTPGGTVPMDFLERDRNGVRLVEGLAAIGRVVLFDRRGIGLSDPISDWSRPLVEQWADDLWVIVSSLCTSAPAVVSLGDYWGPARLFAASHPDALSSLTLYEPTGPDASVDLGGGTSCADRCRWNRTTGSLESVPAVPTTRRSASGSTPPDERARAPRLGADRRPAGRRLCTTAGGRTQAHRRADAGAAPPGQLGGLTASPDPVATAIPRGERVDLPGNDYHWLGDDVDVLLAEISRFVTGRPCFRNRCVGCARWCSPTWSSRPNRLQPGRQAMEGHPRSS